MLPTTQVRKRLSIEALVNLARTKPMLLSDANLGRLAKENPKQLTNAELQALALALFADSGELKLALAYPDKISTGHHPVVELLRTRGLKP